MSDHTSEERHAPGDPESRSSPSEAEPSRSPLAHRAYGLLFGLVAAASLALSAPAMRDAAREVAPSLQETDALRRGKLAAAFSSEIRSRSAIAEGLAAGLGHGLARTLGSYGEAVRLADGYLFATDELQRLPPNEAELRAAIGTLQALDAALAEHSIALHVLPVPLRTAVESHRLPAVPASLGATIRSSEELPALLKAAGLHTLNARVAWRRHGVGAPFRPDDHHWTLDATRAVAAEIATLWDGRVRTPGAWPAGLEARREEQIGSLIGITAAKGYLPDLPPERSDLWRASWSPPRPSDPAWDTPQVVCADSFGWTGLHRLLEAETGIPTAGIVAAALGPTLSMQVLLERVARGYRPERVVWIFAEGALTRAPDGLTHYAGARTLEGLSASTFEVLDRESKGARLRDFPAIGRDFAVQALDEETVARLPQKAALAAGARLLLRPTGLAQKTTRLRWAATAKQRAPSAPWWPLIDAVSPAPVQLLPLAADPLRTPVLATTFGRTRASLEVGPIVSPVQRALDPTATWRPGPATPHTRTWPDLYSPTGEPRAAQAFTLGGQALHVVDAAGAERLSWDPPLAGRALLMTLGVRFGAEASRSLRAELAMGADVEAGGLPLARFHIARGSEPGLQAQALQVQMPARIATRERLHLTLWWRGERPEGIAIGFAREEGR